MKSRMSETQWSTHGKGKGRGHSMKLFTDGVQYSPEWNKEQTRNSMHIERVHSTTVIL